MKVKVGDKIYDGEDEPVMVILTEKDKENIINMADEGTRYCCAPDNSDPKEIEAWMRAE